MKVLMTADRVGGVWQYATDLAGALAPLDVDVVIATIGPCPSGEASVAAPAPLPAPARAGFNETMQTSAAAHGGIAARPLRQGTRWNGAGLARPEPGDTRRSGTTVIDTGLPLDWLCDSPEPLRAAAAALADLAREIGADLVHLNSPALAAAARWPVPVVAVEHGSVAPWWEAAHPDEPLPEMLAWHATAVRDGLIAADAAVAPSAAYAAAVARRYALPTAPTAVHNGRTPAALAPTRRASHAFTAGRLWDQVKRTALLDAIAARTPIRAAGPLAAPHGEMVATRHLHHLGTLDAPALAAELARQPVFVSAASFEPFGLAVLEAAQAGCPLVLSDIPTFRELWDGAAVFVAGEDPADWVAALGRARADRDALGAAARSRAARYTPAATAAAMLALYRPLLERRAAA